MTPEDEKRLADIRSAHKCAERDLVADDKIGFLLRVIADMREHSRSACDWERLAKRLYWEFDGLWQYLAHCANTGDLSAKESAKHQWASERVRKVLSKVSSDGRPHPADVLDLSKCFKPGAAFDSRPRTRTADHWRERCEAWERRAKSLEIELSQIADWALQTIKLVPMRKPKRKAYQWCATCIYNAIANVNEHCPEPKENKT